MSNSVRIGRDIENYLKDYLRRLSIWPKNGNFRLIENDLRLMKSGKQEGLDINWSISFDFLGTEYKWFFEAKGKGKSKHQKSGEYTNFHINIIADKLLQLIGRSDLDIDCWCLFAPYLRLDDNDKRLLKNIENYLPFRLLIWDKNYLPRSLWTVSENLFKEIYPRRRRYPAKNDLDKYINDIKRECIKGRFIKNIHKRFLFIKQDLKTKCEREIILCKELVSTKSLSQDIRHFNYFLEFQGVKFYIEKKYLQKAITDKENLEVKEQIAKALKTENLINIFSYSKNKDNITLYEEIKKYLSDDDIPFAKFIVRHKFKEFREIDFIKLNSSSYFGVGNNKDILFENIIEEL